MKNKIREVKTMGFIGESTWEKKDEGNILFSNDLGLLAQALMQQGEGTSVTVADETLNVMIDQYPDLVKQLFRGDNGVKFRRSNYIQGIEQVTNKNTEQAIKGVVEKGGFALTNKSLRRFAEWIATPNRRNGGH